MRVTVSFDPELRESVLARIQDPGTWPGWVPGLREVVGTPPSLDVRFGGPRPFHCRIAVELPADGVSFQLEEGELQAFSGSITVEPAALHLQVHVQFGPTVPGMLWTSLETDYLRQLVGGLTGVPPGTGPLVD